MKKLFFISLLTVFVRINVNSQVRYQDALFKDIESKTFIYSDTLSLDFYTPLRDTLYQKPLLILVHGGGFAGGKKDNPLEKKFCVDMVQRGFAVASISYHLTRKGKSFSCDCSSDEKLETFKRVTQDVLSATQYLVRNNENLGFDPNKIILIGSSAGAEAVLNTVFMRNHPDFKTLPYDSIQFAGVVSFAGAVLNTDYITSKTALPTLLFHGKKDKLVPFGSAPHHYCSEEMPGYLPLNGSGVIAQKLRKLGVSYTLFYDNEGNHDWANLAYGYVDEIATFLKETVLQGAHVQSEIRVRSNSKQ